MAENSAQIDLKANPETLKDGIAEGTKFIEDFAKETIKSMEDSEVSVDKLEASFKELVEQLSKVIKETGDSTNETLKTIDATNKHRDMLHSLLGVVKDNIVTIGILTAVVIKSGGSMAEKAAKVGALIKALGILGSVAINATIGLAKLTSVTLIAGKTIAATTLSITQKTARLIYMTASLTKANPIVAAFAATVALLGTVFTATGKKLEVMDLSLKTSRELVAKYNGDVKLINAELEKLGVTAEEMGLKQTSNWNRISDSFGELFEKVTKFGALTSAIGGYISSLWESTSKYVNDWVNSTGDGINYALKEWSRYYTAAEDKTTAYYMWLTGATKEQIEEELKLRVAARSRAEAEAASTGAVAKAAHEASIKRAKELDDATMESQRVLRQYNDIQNFVNIEGIKGTKEAIKEHYRLRQVLIDSGRFAGEYGDKWEEKLKMLKNRQQELIDQNQEWVDAKNAVTNSLHELGEEWEKIKQAEVQAQAPIGTLLAMLDDEIEKRDQLRKVNKGSTKEFIESINRVNELRNAIHNQQIENIAKENAKQLEAINNEIAKRKELKQINQSVEDVQREVDQDKILTDLEKQGATIKQLHEQKLKFIDEEEAIANARRENPNDEINNEKIKAEFAKQRIRLVAQFQKETNADVTKLAEINIDHKHDVEMRRLEALGESEKEMHKLRIKQIDEEEQRLLKMANTESEKQKIKFDAEDRRLKEQAAIKKIDVKKPEQVKAPKTRAEYYAMVKKQKEAAKVAAQLAKLQKPAHIKKVEQANAKKARLEAKKIAETRRQAEGLLADVKGVHPAMQGPNANDPKIIGEKTKPVLEKIAEAVTLSARMDALIAKDLADFGKI